MLQTPCRYFERLADEAEEGLKHNNLRPVYKAIQRMRVSDRMHGLASIHKSDGTPCSSTNEVLAQWSEHYEAALNHPAAAPCPALNATASSAADDPGTPVDAPTLDKVRTTI
jgi:hypothetical protein